MDPTTPTLPHHPRPIARRWLARTFLVFGPTAGIRHYRQLAHDAPHLFDESSLNFVGYQLLHHERLAEALAVFQLTVDAHPHSANAHDSLGEAQLKAGLHHLAFQSYWRSLELDPGNGNAREMLLRLGN